MTGKLERAVEHAAKMRNKLRDRDARPMRLARADRALKAAEARAAKGPGQ